MASAWQAPDDWKKDGSTLSGISSLKTGAWTSMLAAKESHPDGKQTDVVIKIFSVPQDILQDPDRISKERAKFLTSARLQKELSDSGAKAWVDIHRISEDPANTAFSMKKCGASLQDLIDRKVQLSANDLYQIALAILQGFAELFERKQRSHGSLKASDVMAAPPGDSPAYRLADPAPKGDSHSANDLYALGLIIYELVEHKEWDPLTPIIPTKNWARFGSKRDRWIQFLNMLLSPNGCQEPLAQVRKEALRLKPVSPMRNASLVAASLLVLAGAGAAIWHFLPALRAPAPAAPSGGVAGPVIDGEVKAAWQKAHDAYMDISTKWTSREPSPRYEHTKSRDLARLARTLIPEGSLTDTATYTAATEGYHKAADKLQEALDAYAAEEKVGLADDAAALTEFQKAQQDFVQVKAAWDAAAQKFNPKHDHSQSTALAQATQSPGVNAPASAADRRMAAEQFRAASARLQSALARAKEEEIAGLSVEQAQANFQEARAKYQAARERWDAASVGVTIDFSAAKTVADQARAQVAEPLVLSDPASYQKGAEVFQAATVKIDQAYAQLEEAKKDHNQKEADVGTAVTRANDALQKQDYATALSWYIKAGNLGNAPAMFNAGELYELGRGTDKDEAEAARWYQKAADLRHTEAMISLALMHEKGRGVSKSYTEALALYKKASDLNDPHAMRNIAYLYNNGLGVEKDPAEALRWNRKAADLGDGTAMALVGAAYEQGVAVPIDYTQAFAWYQKGATAKSARAMNALGVLYETGRGTAQDPAQAMAWYKKAADLNLAAAMSNIGALYDNGIGVTLDHAEALKWFHKGADLGNGMSMFNLAVLYETGRGTKADLPAALEWYRKAAVSDDAQARTQAIARLDALGFSH